MAIRVAVVSDHHLKRSHCHCHTLCQGFMMTRMDPVFVTTLSVVAAAAVLAKKIANGENETRPSSCREKSNQSTVIGVNCFVKHEFDLDLVWLCK